jgi:2-keto-4-pentenoate hydratase/2-oxohepta-3-ene-1,7-dioic acid hydratase in catechol pathway
VKIICIGRNYADHAKELGNQVPAEPVIFLKPETALVPKRNPFFIPDFSTEVHYELELVVRINKIGKHIQEKFAHKYYNQVTVGIDFTARDLQQKLKEKGLPWEKAKAFDGSAAIGKWVDIEAFPDLENLPLRLEKNDVVVQADTTANMLFSVDRLIAEVSKYFTLKIGDLLFTGTPAGVGPVKINDTLKGFLNETQLFELNVK